MNEIQLFAENELTVAESDERAFHEKVVDDVKDGIEKLASIGDASLKVLRDKRLYRATHKTFEDYCQERFGFDRRYINRQIFHGAMREILGPNGPKKEAQSRPLASLPTPELQAQAWEQAQADSGKEQPSNREVAEAVVKVQAELESERQSRKLAEQRAQEFGVESNERRLKIRELETQIDLLKAQPAPEPEIKEVEKIPEDYESTKRQAADLQKQLADLQKQQSRLVNDQVKAKLQGYQDEVNEMEKKKAIMEEQVARMKSYMESLDSEAKCLEVHQSVINGSRLELISLAAFLSDLDPINDPDTIKRWLALADMHEEAMKTIRWVFGERRPELTVIRGDAA